MKRLLVVAAVWLSTSGPGFAENPGRPPEVRNLSALYLNFGHVFLYRAWKADISLVLRDRWIISAHVFGGTVHDAPGKPNDYMAPIPLPSGSGGGSGLFDLGLTGWWASTHGDKDQRFARNNPSRIVWAKAITGGRIWTVKGQDFKLRFDGGPAFLRVDEAKNFLWQEREQLKAQYASSGHIFQRQYYNTLGLLLRAGADYRIGRRLGFTLGAESIFSHRLVLPGLYAGLMVGFLR